MSALAGRIVGDGDLSLSLNEWRRRGLRERDPKRAHN